MLERIHISISQRYTPFDTLHPECPRIRSFAAVVNRDPEIEPHGIAERQLSIVK